MTIYENGSNRNTGNKCPMAITLKLAKCLILKWNIKLEFSKKSTKSCPQRWLLQNSELRAVWLQLIKPKNPRKRLISSKIWICKVDRNVVSQLGRYNRDGRILFGNFVNALLCCKQCDEKNVLLLDLVGEKQRNRFLNGDSSAQHRIKKHNSSFADIGHETRVKNLLVVADQNFANTNRSKTMFENQKLATYRQHFLRAFSIDSPERQIDTPQLPCLKLIPLYSLDVGVVMTVVSYGNWLRPNSIACFIRRSAQKTNSEWSVFLNRGIWVKTIERWLTCCGELYATHRRALSAAKEPILRVMIPWPTAKNNVKL